MKRLLWLSVLPMALAACAQQPARLPETPPAAALSTLLGTPPAPPTAPSLPDPSAKDEADVLEAVFRYQFEHNASAMQQDADWYFISLGDDADPPAAFVARFAGHTPPVLPVSASTSSDDGGVRHARRGGRGLVFRVEGVRWHGRDSAEVGGGYHEAGLSGSGNIYRVKRQAGRWVVTGDTMEWIS